MRAAQIDKNGNVVNVIVLPDDFEGDEWDGLKVIETEEAGPEWTWDEKSFSAPIETEDSP